MARLSFTFLISALLAPFCHGQTEPIPLPQITDAAGGNLNCGGCYIVADVAGIVFGTETLTQTHTAVVSVGIGFNGTNITRTSIQYDTGIFTIATNGLVDPTGAVAATSFDYHGGIITIAGATLTSPTAYNVFTAYSVTQTYTSGGNCIVSAGPRIILSSAFSVAIPPDVDLAAFAVLAESSFVQSFGPATCTPGGANIGSTSHIPVSNSTSFITTSGPILPSLVPQTTVIIGTSASTTVTVAPSTSTPASPSSTVPSGPASTSSPSSSSRGAVSSSRSVASSSTSATAPSASSVPASTSPASASSSSADAVAPSSSNVPASTSTQEISSSASATASSAGAVVSSSRSVPASTSTRETSSSASATASSSSGVAAPTSSIAAASSNSVPSPSAPAVASITPTFVPFGPFTAASTSVYLPGGTGLITIVPAAGAPPSGSTLSAWIAGALGMLLGLVAL